MPLVKGTKKKKNSMRVKGINVLHYCHVMHFTNIILLRSSCSAPAVKYTSYEVREMNNEEMAGVFPLGDEDWESRATVGVRNAVLALGKLALAESTLILTDVGCLGNKAVPDWRRGRSGVAFSRGGEAQQGTPDPWNYLPARPHQKPSSVSVLGNTRSFVFLLPVSTR